MKLDEERKLLEHMLTNSSGAINQNVPTPADAPELQNPSAFELDIPSLKKQCDDEARRMVEKAIGFVLNEDQTKDEYVKYKMENDIFSLSGMLYQLRCNERMQQALMEEIAHGAMHPRMFEVFGQLSTTIGALNKQLLQTVEAIKLSTKDIKHDIKEKQTEMLGPVSSSTGMISTGNGGVLTMGTKELIKKVKKDKLEDRINSIKDSSSNIIEDAIEIN